jgi:hemolysin activation/secretion protein
MIKTKKFLLTTFLVALLTGNSALAGEPAHFFRDPLTKDKHFSANQVFNQEKEKVGLSLPEIGTKNNTQANFVLRKIDITGNNSINFAELGDTIKPYMNKKLNSHSISITKAIENYYKQQGYLLPLASIENSDKDTGSVTIKIIEGKIRSVSVETDKNSESIKNNNLLKQYIDAIVNLSPATTKEVQKYLLLIEKIPGYQIEYQLRQTNTDDANMADLLLAIKKTRGTLSLDVTNHGNKDLGKYQYSGFMQLNNSFELNESIILSTGTSNHPSALKLVSLGFLKRLNAYGTSVSVFGSWLEDNPYKYSKTNRGHAKDNNNFTFRGTLSQYLALNNTNSFKLEVGAEYKDVSTNIIGQKSIEYDYTMAFAKAKIKHVDFLNAENWLIPTVNKARKTKIHLYETGAYTFDKDFTFYTIDWFRDQPLFKSDFSFYTQAMCQMTNDNLPVEHQFFIGSNSVGRAYKSGLINSNKGSAASAELRYTKEFNNKVINVVQPYIYGDIAHFNTDKAITNNQTTTSTFNKKSLSSAGGGLRLFFPHDINAETEIGVPLDKNIKINNMTTKNKNKYSFSVSKTFKW